MVRCLDTWDGLVPTIFSIEPEDKKKRKGEIPSLLHANESRIWFTLYSETNDR